MGTQAISLKTKITQIVKVHWVPLLVSEGLTPGCEEFSLAPKRKWQKFAPWNVRCMIGHEHRFSKHRCDVKSDKYKAQRPIRLLCTTFNCFFRFLTAACRRYQSEKWTKKGALHKRPLRKVSSTAHTEYKSGTDQGAYHCLEIVFQKYQLCDNLGEKIYKVWIQL